jgi:hypothetical protein
MKENDTACTPTMMHMAAIRKVWVPRRTVGLMGTGPRISRVPRNRPIASSARPG